MSTGVKKMLIIFKINTRRTLGGNTESYSLSPISLVNNTNKLDMHMLLWFNNMFCFEGLKNGNYIIHSAVTADNGKCVFVLFFVFRHAYF